MVTHFGKTSEYLSLWVEIKNPEMKNYFFFFLLFFIQGCYNLVKAGADGVIQAMVLSFGSFRFSKQHLEFNMHPSFLHRNYHFRYFIEVSAIISL